MNKPSVKLRESDSKGRVTLPRGFAKSPLLIEVVSDVELIIRKANVVPMRPVEDPTFAEERPIALSGEDRDAFLAALDRPPPPNEALKRLLADAKDPG